MNDNLTNGMIKFSAKIDITDILKAVKNSRYDYSQLKVINQSFLIASFEKLCDFTLAKGIIINVNIINGSAKVLFNKFE